MASFRILSNWTLQKLHVKFVYLFSGALYDYLEFKNAKCSVPVNPMLLHIGKDLEISKLVKFIRSYVQIIFLDGFAGKRFSARILLLGYMELDYSQ